MIITFGLCQSMHVHLYTVSSVCESAVSKATGVIDFISVLSQQLFSEGVFAQV